jgi:hypothetical protein
VKVKVNFFGVHHKFTTEETCYASAWELDKDEQTEPQAARFASRKEQPAPIEQKAGWDPRSFWMV